MHSYSYPDYISNRWGDKVLIAQRTRNVRSQGFSPRQNGKLQIRANGLDVWTDSSRHQLMNGFANESYNRGTSSYSYTSGVVNTNGSPVVTRLHSEAITEAQNKFLDEVSGIRVNLLDLYRTRIEAANMVAKNAQKLCHAYTLLKKGKWRQFCRTLGISAKKPRRGQDNVPALWLEYSFGWAPLLSDIYTMLDNTFDVPAAFVRQVYRAEYPDTRQDNSANTRVSVSGTYKVRGVAAGLVFVDVPAIQAASQYGITNPLATAWEALPFSFVVDWFVPVGDFINSLNATAGLKFKDYSLTSTIEWDAKVTAIHRYSTWDNWADAGSGNSTYHWKHKKRQVNDRPSWLYPGPKGPMDQSLTRASYALSLVASIFGSRK